MERAWRPARVFVASERARDRLEFFAFCACAGAGRRARRRLRRFCVRSRARGAEQPLTPSRIAGACSRPTAHRALKTKRQQQDQSLNRVFGAGFVQSVQRGGATSALMCVLVAGLGEASPARFLDSLHQHYTYRAGRGPIWQAQKNSVSAAAFGMSGAARSSPAAARRRRQQRAETSATSAAVTRTMQTAPTG